MDGCHWGGQRQTEDERSGSNAQSKARTVVPTPELTPAPPLQHQRRGAAHRLKIRDETCGSRSTPGDLMRDTRPKGKALGEAARDVAVIDAHVHVWKLDAPWMDWLRARPETWDVIRRDFPW